MPELPDVETFRRYVDSTSLHQRVTGVEVRDAKVLKTSAKKLHELLEGCELEETRRHGKHLLVRSGERGWLGMHFGMTGRPAYWRRKESEPKYVRVVLGFESGYMLGFVNQRRFGRLDVAESVDEYVARHDLGPDALEVGREEFVEALSGRGAAVKSALMDQSLVAGVGNIWTDEVLFQAGAHPMTPARELGDEALGELWRVMRRVLRTGVRHGADTDELPVGYLLRHRRKGAECPGECGGEVETLKVGGRTTYFCPACQQR